MTSVRFRAGEIGLELSGSETFVERQLRQFAPYLGAVDVTALGATGDSAAAHGNGHAAETAKEHVPIVINGDDESEDGVTAFYRSMPRHGADRQADAALLFAYYLQRKEGLSSLRLGDLIRCCIRAGVDTRNFNQSLGALTRRGYLETLQQGHSYRLSDHGAEAVESRM